MNMYLHFIHSFIYFFYLFTVDSLDKSLCFLVEKFITLCIFWL